MRPPARRPRCHQEQTSTLHALHILNKHSQLPASLSHPTEQPKVQHSCNTAATRRPGCLAHLNSAMVLSSTASVSASLLLLAPRRSLSSMNSDTYSGLRLLVLIKCSNACGGCRGMAGRWTALERASHGAKATFDCFFIQ